MRFSLNRCCGQRLDCRPLTSLTHSIGFTVLLCSVCSGQARYKYTHEVGGPASCAEAPSDGMFAGEFATASDERRMSVIFRDIRTGP